MAKTGSSYGGKPKKTYNAGAAVVRHGGDARQRDMKIVSNAWWLEPRKGSEGDECGTAVAHKITEVATRLETAYYQDRWRSLVYYRHFYGRPSSAQFAYGMAKRPTGWVSYYAGFEFQAPVYNLIATCADVYVNRLFRNKTFMEVIPERGAFAQRQASKGLTEWTDPELTQLGYWDLRTRMGLDSMTFGSGVLRFWPDFTNKNPSIKLVGKDELLLENPEEPNPQWIIQREWASRSDLLEVYKDNEDAVRAIRNAQSAQAAFFFGPGLLDVSNIIPVLGAWRLNHITGVKGRYCLIVGDYALCDDKFDSDCLPFEKFDFHTVSSSYFGQGLAEIMMECNSQVNEKLGDMAEVFRRLAWPRWLVEENSGVNDAALGDSPGVIVKYQITPPQLASPPTVNPEIPQHIDRLIRLGMARAHISERANQGEIPAGLRSAPALMKFAQIDDANFAEMAERLEAFDRRCAMQVIRLGIKLKPETNLPGYSKPLVRWDIVEKAFKDRPVSLKSFGVNRLSQDPAGRQEKIDAMLANGEISKATHAKLSQTPDVDGELDMINAPQDSVDKMLDEILVDEYRPPMPFMDLVYAKSRVEQRWCLEYNRGTDRGKLDLLLLWRAAVIGLKQQLTTPDSAPPAMLGPNPAGPAQLPPVDPGFAPQDNPAIAPSEPQIAPTMGPPPVMQ